jgi:arylsulfatase A-like enzyme
MSILAKVFRWSGWVILGGVVAIIALHIYNAIRLNVFELNRHVGAVVDRTEDVSRQALPEYQDLALARLAPSPVNGAFYRFDDNLDAARITDHSTDTSPDEDDISEFVFQLEFDGGPEPQLVAANGQSTMEQRDGFLIVTQGGEDFLATSGPLQIPVSSISEVIIRARADKGNRFRLLWAAEGRESAIDKNRLDLDLIADGEFQTYVVNVQDAFRRGVSMDENISMLGIAPSNVDGAVVEIEFVRLVSKLWKYEFERAGTSYESLDGDLRPVLHMISNQRLDYEVDVPADHPRMSFGAAALLENPPIEASISIVDDTGSTAVFASPTPSSELWQDEVVDLSRWAGQTVRVVFEARGDGQNVVFWSNPMIRSAPLRRFNVIVMLEDALRADHLSTQGHIRETSPEKTRLMNERGIVFENAHSQATKTRPSIASLMTGLYPTATGVWNFSDRLSDRYLTLAEIMRAQGFITASFIQNGNAGPYAGDHQGFSSLREAETLGETTQDVFGEHTLAWLDENRDNNFFLYLHSTDPHGVYDPPPPYDRWYREADPAAMVGTRRLPAADSIDPEWAETPSADARRILYDGEILHNDAVLGEFIRELDKRGTLEDTVLIFIADHGEWMGERGYWEHHPPGNRPVIHVPLMVVYPKAFPNPARIVESVQLIDVMPTILELAEVDTSELLMHGDSLAGLIQGNDPDRWAKRVTVSEEPMAMDRNDPCVCGSLFFDEWQLHGSTQGWPRRVKLEFIKSAVYRFREDGITPVTSFLPDLSIRILRNRALSRIQTANMSMWRTITEGEAGDIYKMDPDTLEELRGLGYVN